MTDVDDSVEFDNLLDKLNTEREYGVIYTDYVDLLPFEDENTNDHFDQALIFSSSDDWKEQFISIELLRRINKYETDTIENRIMETFKFLKHWLNSPRTCLGKNTLVLCQEIYMQQRSELLIEFTWNIIPTIVKKTGHESNFLKTEAQIALQFLAANMPYPKWIDSLWLESDSKNVRVKEFVWKSMTIAIQNIDIDYPESLMTLFETISKALTVSKSFEGRESVKILKVIGKEKCKDIWDMLIDQGNNNQAERIMKVFDDKKGRKKKGGMRTLLKKFKKKAMNNNNSDNFCVFN